MTTATKTNCVIGLSDVYRHEVTRFSYSTQVDVFANIGGRETQFSGSPISDVAIEQLELAMNLRGLDTVSTYAQQSHANRTPIQLNADVIIVYDDEYLKKMSLRDEVAKKQNELLEAIKKATEPKLSGPRFFNDTHVLIARMDKCINIMQGGVF